MTRKKVTVVFDIGRTNKKVFLFDPSYKEVFRKYVHLPETVDEDGYPSEDLDQLQKWIKETFDAILEDKEFDVNAVNFSSYGASFVHIDHQGKVLTPLYNYTKPVEKSITDQFYKDHGEELKIAMETGSPQCGFLNSGMQLYWIKKKHPEVFKSIKYSLHLPQFLSYLFTGIPLSEYTSIGCHTNLWDLNKKDYHDWVYKEEIDQILPPIVPTSTSLNLVYKKNRIKIGIGIHDSSSALLPYTLSEKDPFLLLSTGTMSIALNPFNEERLGKEDILNNCLNYMRMDGKRVKACRFLMGNEYKLQVEKLGKFFNKDKGYHRNLKFSPEIYSKLTKEPSVKFKFEQIILDRQQIPKTNLLHFENYEEAYHQLMIELMELQIYAITNAIGNSEIKTIFIDGGFTDNEVFIKLVAYHFDDFNVLTTQSPLGSALGAAISISDSHLDSTFLKKNYSLKKHVPFILQ